MSTLRGPVQEVKRRVSPTGPFGVGLRIAARAARELTDGGLDTLRNLLDEQDMYAFTVNGFPYGAFHGRPVKADVYSPDWSHPARVDYTLELSSILTSLLPEGANGSISTVPLGYGAWTQLSEMHKQTMLRHLQAVVVALWKTEQQSGKRISLALEPEPDCMLQLTSDVIEVFQNHLLSGPFLGGLARQCGTGLDGARDICQRYLGVCIDACHAAVEFESAAFTFEALKRHGVSVFKVQLSSGLRALGDRAQVRAALSRYDEPVYLHQVVVRRGDGTLIRYPDLGPALSGQSDEGVEWRVHFHVPLHIADYPPLGSTRPFVEQVLALHRSSPICEHLEVETYTWDVLPDKPTTVTESISRELQWVIEQL